MRGQAGCGFGRTEHGIGRRISMVNTVKYAWSRVAVYVTGNSTDSRLPILTGIVGGVLLAFSELRLFSQYFF